MGIFSSITDSIGLTNYGASEAAVRRANAYFAGLTPPELKALGLESVGDMTPEQIRAFIMESSAFEDIYVDPRLKQNQMDALESLKDISKTGLNATDRAALAKIQQQEEAAARGAREAIIQNAQERGVAGSGLELMSQMQNQQDAATRQSARDTEVAALSQQRKDAALLNLGNMSGQIRDQEYNEQAKLAEAKDLMNKFNLSNQQNVEAQNVAARNTAQQYNLANAQAIDNQNKQWAAGIDQQDFQNRLGLANAQAQGQYQLANMYNQQSQGGLQAAGSAALAYAAFASDEKAKKDVEFSGDDIDNFLNEITGCKFSYKDPKKHGEGERLGVMAQDMEKSNVGKDIVFTDGEGTKKVDAEKALSAVLASTARLNERLNQVENKNGKK